MSKKEKYIIFLTFIIIIISYNITSCIVYDILNSKINTLEYKLHRVESQYQVLLNKIKKIEK